MLFRETATEEDDEIDVGVEPLPAKAKVEPKPVKKKNIASIPSEEAIYANLMSEANAAFASGRSALHKFRHHLGIIKKEENVIIHERWLWRIGYLLALAVETAVLYGPISRAARSPLTGELTGIDIASSFFAAAVGVAAAGCFKFAIEFMGKKDMGPKLMGGLLFLVGGVLPGLSSGLNARLSDPDLNQNGLIEFLSFLPRIPQEGLSALGQVLSGDGLNVMLKVTTYEFISMGVALAAALAMLKTQEKTDLLHDSKRVVEQESALDKNTSLLVSSLRTGVFSGVFAFGAYHIAQSSMGPNAITAYGAAIVTFVMSFVAFSKFRTQEVKHLKIPAKRRQVVDRIHTEMGATPGAAVSQAYAKLQSRISEAKAADGNKNPDFFEEYESRAERAFGRASVDAVKLDEQLNEQSNQYLNLSKKEEKSLGLR